MGIKKPVLPGPDCYIICKKSDLIWWLQK